MNLVTIFVLLGSNWLWLLDFLHIITISWVKLMSCVKLISFMVTNFVKTGLLKKKQFDNNYKFMSQKIEFFFYFSREI